LKNKNSKEDNLINNNIKIKYSQKRKDLHKNISPLINNKKLFVLFSGGKDSLVALDLIKKIASKAGKKVTAIHADTTVGLPCNIKYVKKICKKLNIKLKIVRPKVDYFTLAERWGLPRFQARWCCYALKTGPVNDYLKKQQEDKIVFDGIRAEESRKRREMEFMNYNKKFGYITCHPLLYWTSVDVKMHLEKNGLPINPAYEKGFKRASECWCGVFKNPSEFELLLNQYPEMFDRLLELEKKQKSNYAYIYSGGKKTYLHEIKSKCISENNS